MFNKTFENTKNKLNEVGCGFCLAKWTQATLHLQVGQTHSCHHPVPHQVGLSELPLNPSSLHNSVIKKRQRKTMLEGGRPEECNYCWNIEDNSTSFSDRAIKSSEPWSIKHYDEIKDLHWREDFNPRYVEVAFSNQCNFKCSYCGPTYSSQWVQEIEQHGGYPTSTNFNNLDFLFGRRLNPLPYLHSEHNPYVEAFWKWWPELYKDLHTFRITGGEPLLNKDTWNVLDFILESQNPNRNLNLSVNTNLGAPDKLFNEFVVKIKRLIDENRVNELIVFTSADTWGPQAEYIRHGMVFNQWWDRINILLREIPQLTVIVMSTYNALSVPNYEQLIRNVYKLKEEYHSPDRYYGSSVMLDSSYLRWPKHQSIKILDDTWGRVIKRQTQVMDFYEQVRVGLDGYGFTEVETNKMNRIFDWFNVPENEDDLKLNRSDFKKFIDEHDKRRKTNFLKIFPELEDFYKNIEI
jgi:hypothetical protein